MVFMGADERSGAGVCAVATLSVHRIPDQRKLDAPRGFANLAGKPSRQSMNLTQRVATCFCAGSLAAAIPLKAEQGFRPLFDGHSLAGWETPEPSYWSVEDGAIIGRITKE